MPSTVTVNLYVPLWSRLTFFKTNVAGLLTSMSLKGLLELIVFVAPFKVISEIRSDDLLLLKDHCLKNIVAPPKSYVHGRETSDPFAT